MKTVDGREIPMWEAKTTEPMRCPFCKKGDPLATRAYCFKKGQPMVPLCDTHRLPESVDFMYLTNPEQIPEYEPSLLCGEIHLMPVISGLHWCHQCTHVCYRCGDDKQDKTERIGIGDREMGACLSCEAYPGPGRCTGCRGSSVHLGDPDYHYYHVPMMNWVWDRYIKGTILATKQTDNLYEAEFNCDNPAEAPTIFFNLSEGGKRFGMFDIGMGLINYLLRWKPVPRFDQNGNALEPWIYSVDKLRQFCAKSVGMAYMTADNTACGVLSFDIGDELDKMSEENKQKFVEAMQKVEEQAAKAEGKAAAE